MFPEGTDAEILVQALHVALSPTDRTGNVTIRTNASIPPLRTAREYFPLTKLRDLNLTT